MDFEVTYTPEQQAFREAVRTWLIDNIPEGLVQPIDPGDLSLEQYQKLRELGRRLGSRGWLYPTYPKAYGGGELPVDFVIILGILYALGPYALTKDEAWGPLNGLLEFNQRSSVVGLHPGGTTDIQKVIMARRIGIGRNVKEQAGRLR